MATRTVRLDEESEEILGEIQEATGLSVSGALKHGLLAARKQMQTEGAANPYAVYNRIDLGPGGYARAPARMAKTAIREVLQEKKRKRR